jgi:SAM-dependent methyltransferase
MKISPLLLEDTVIMDCQDFYQNHAKDYFKQTFQVDPASFLMPLNTYLPLEAKVLDIGCGSGRDMLWLQHQGHHCMGLERSLALAALAGKHTGLPVFEADFESFDFRQLKMDALLLIGALVHVPHNEFPPIFQRTLEALKPQGLVLITMKQGQGSKTAPDGRVFYLWEKDRLVSVFKDCQMRVLEYSVQNSHLRRSDTWMGFVLQMELLCPVK